LVSCSAIRGESIGRCCHGPVLSIPSRCQSHSNTPQGRQLPCPPIITIRRVSASCLRR
jgi:hypothetical protein